MPLLSSWARARGGLLALVLSASPPPAAAAVVTIKALSSGCCTFWTLNNLAMWDTIRPRREELVEIVTRLLVMQRAATVDTPRVGDELIA